MRKPVNVLQQGANVDAIVHITAITVARAMKLGGGPPVQGK
jgi:phosphotransacetylase